MTRSWFRQQLLDKLIFGLIASLVAGYFIFEFDKINDKLSLSQKSSDVQIEHLQNGFNKFSEAILSTLSLLTQESEGALKKTADRLELRDPILKLGLQARIYASLFPDDAEPKEHLQECLAVFNGKLNYSNLKSISKSTVNQSIKSLQSCHHDSAEKMVPYLQKLINDNYSKANKGNSSITFWVFICVIGSLIALVGWLYMRSPE